ncbi:MAG: TlpA family protein disulfide reductase [Bacteroidia bacterium]
MREVLIPAIAGVLYSILIGFSFSFRDHLVTYAVASVLIIPAGYYFNRIASFLAFLFIPSLLTLIILLVNSAMFSITIPITGVGMLIGYLTGFGVYFTRNYYWKWVIPGIYVLVSTAILFFIIPRWLLSSSVEENKQTLILPPSSALLTDKQQQLELSNKILVIEFWQSNCTACLQQFSVLDRVQEKYKSSSDVAIIAMNTGKESEEQALSAFLKRESKLYAALDNNQQFSNQLAVNDIPVLVIVDRNNRVHWKHNGFYPEERNILDKEIIKHIEEIR